jgi:GPI mannosyltransferase 1 subunit M
MVFGKVVFIAADLLCGVLLHRLLTARGMHAAAAHRWVALLWLFNPFVVTITTRGSAEALVAALVLATVAALYARRVAAAGVLFGLAVQFKVYTVIYALPIFFFLDADYDHAGGAAEGPGWGAQVRRLLSPTRLVFTAVSAGTFLGLSALMYHMYGGPRAVPALRCPYTDLDLWGGGGGGGPTLGVNALRYGWPYVHETFLYHLTRRDHRHNFSPYFYMLYLGTGNATEGTAGVVGAVAAFLPQLVLLVVLGTRFYRDLPFCLFVQTVAFVAWNKVCTSQYFVWYLTWAPLVVPMLRLPLAGTGGAVLAGWVVSQVLWLQAAYQLEFEGADTYRSIWLAGLALFLAHVAVLVAAVSGYRGHPVFRNGKITRLVPAP